MKEQETAAIEFARGKPKTASAVYLVRVYDSGSGNSYATELMMWSGRNWTSPNKEIDNGSDVFFAGPIESACAMVLRLANEEDLAARAKLSLNREFGKK